MQLTKIPVFSGVKCSLSVNIMASVNLLLSNASNMTHQYVVSKTPTFSAAKILRCESGYNIRVDDSPWQRCSVSNALSKPQWLDVTKEERENERYVLTLNCRERSSWKDGREIISERVYSSLEGSCKSSQLLFPCWCKQWTSNVHFCTT